MNMDSDQPQFFAHPASQPLQTSRAIRSLHNSTPFSEPEGASPSPLPNQARVANDYVLQCIHGLKHLDDQHILDLLRVARGPSGPDRYSISTIDSRASSFLSIPSRAPSIFSNPRDSVSTTDTRWSTYTSASRLSQAPSVTTAKKFGCTFCDKTLKTKAYWKSHEEEFHEQAQRWKCPDCEQWFNAGKRFREHHYKCHACEKCEQSKDVGPGHPRKPSTCVKKAMHPMHNKDAWGCGFCAKLLGSWEERCDHIAQHFEDGAQKTDWKFTNVISGLLQQSRISVAWNALLTAKHGDSPQHWPQFSWDPKKTASFTKYNKLRFSLEEGWDTRAFDVDNLVQQVYELGEVESTNQKTEPIMEIDMIEEKVVPSNDVDMEISIEPDYRRPSHAEPPQFQQPHWEAPSQETLKPNGSQVSLPTTTYLDSAFSQPLTTEFDQSTLFDSSFYNDSIQSFNHIGSYMDYTTNEAPPVNQLDHNMGFPKAMSSPYIAPTTPAPPPPVPTPNSSHRARLVSITTRRQPAPAPAPPPPPPKDRVSSQMGVRRFPDNSSRHAILPPSSWHNEDQWG